MTQTPHDIALEAAMASYDKFPVGGKELVKTVIDKYLTSMREQGYYLVNLDSDEVLTKITRIIYSTPQIFVSAISNRGEILNADECAKAAIKALKSMAEKNA